jgi:hypothetical protein
VSRGVCAVVVAIEPEQADGVSWSVAMTWGRRRFRALLVIFARVTSRTPSSQFSIAQRPLSQPATCPATSRGISRYFSSAAPSGALSLALRAMRSV